MKVGMIIVAAGLSERMNGINKMFAQINGKEIITSTLINSNNAQNVDYIVLVTRADMIEKMQNIVTKYNISKVIKIVNGENTRQESVKNGLSVCKEDTEIIAVHDGARPFASSKLIEKTIEACEKYRAVMPGVKVKETIKKVENGFIKNTPVRDKLYIAQTPQVFDFKLYKKAFDIAEKENKNFTDDCQLVENIGEKVYVCEGDYNNIKITTIEDLKNSREEF